MSNKRSSYFVCITGSVNWNGQRVKIELELYSEAAAKDKPRTSSLSQRMNTTESKTDPDYLTCLMQTKYKNNSRDIRVYPLKNKMK